ncbi:MAG: ZIP family metal transporter [Patescibacteria group bacterium]
MEQSLLLLIILASLIGGIFSLIGGFFLLWKTNFTKRIIIHLVTFAAGTLLGVAFLDILPEAFEAFPGDPTPLLPWVLAGMVTFYLIEAILIRLHVHDETEVGEQPSFESHHQRPSRGSLPWFITIGDGIHNFVDGIAITAAFLVSIPTGIVTALAVAAHEIPQEISDFSILIHGGLSRRRVAWLNVGASLMTTLGAILAYIFRDTLTPYLPYVLALTAGIFIYIASSDLIPEIQAHHHRRDKPAHTMIILVLAVLLAGWVTATAHQYLEADAERSALVNHIAYTS